MQYLRFKSDCSSRVCYGRLNGDMVEVMTGDLLAGTAAPSGETVALESITTVLPPVQPPNIIAIGANYVDHCKECDTPPPRDPLVFVKTTNSLTGHRTDIRLPRFYPEQVDYEAELAVIIGRKARYVSEKEALDYVFGYTCANDISARDVQLKIDRQWARGKSFDTFCPLGPYITTEVEDVNALHVKLYLNGELMQDQPVSDMIFNIPRIVSHLSSGLTLLPGTVILTGTPAGVGMGRKPPRFLRAGDTVTVDIDSVGNLQNHVVNEPEHPPDNLDSGGGNPFWTHSNYKQEATH